MMLDFEKFEDVDVDLTRRYTLEEYMTLPEGPPYYELEDGVLIPVFSTHGFHGRWMGRTFAYMDDWTRDHGGFVSQEVGTMPGGDTGYIPDIVYVRDERMESCFKRGRIYGLPDLAVEIFNRDGARRDRVKKFEKYRGFGLEWYWLVSYEEQIFEEYHLEDGVYIRTVSAGIGDEFRPLAMPGLVIPVTDIAR